MIPLCPILSCLKHLRLPLPPITFHQGLGILFRRRVHGCLVQRRPAPSSRDGNGTNRYMHFIECWDARRAIMLATR